MRAVTGAAEIVRLGVRGLAEVLTEGQVSAREAAQVYLSRIAAVDGEIGAYYLVTEELALAGAAASDARRARGEALGLLDGVPIAIKDNIDLAGVPTTGGLAAYRDHIAARDATVVARLKAAGAVVLGKLAMHEGALGATTDNPHFGRCHNPYRRGWTPGGSSGGSGAAVAAGLCAAALGTDTMGSVRIPSAYCGVAGMKPSYGRVSQAGVMPLSWSLDHVGPLARNVEDVAVMLSAMSGADPDDPWSEDYRSLPSAWLGERRGGALRGLSFGVPVGLAEQAAGPVLSNFRASLDLLRREGAEAVDIHLGTEDMGRWRRSGLVLCEAEASLYHAEMLKARSEGFSEGFKALLAYGAARSAVEIVRILRDFAELRARLGRNLHAHDAILLPTTPHVAFSFDDPVPVSQADFTAFANFAGLPAISVPNGVSADGLPTGLQIVGARGADDHVLRIAHALEAVLGPGPLAPQIAVQR